VSEQTRVYTIEVWRFDQDSTTRGKHGTDFSQYVKGTLHMLDQVEKQNQVERMIASEVLNPAAGILVSGRTRYLFRPGVDIDDLRKLDAPIC
jgi:hypothetical protein